MRMLLYVHFILLCASNCFAYYQTQQGRWVSRDPFGEQGGVNIYAQSKNAPVNRVDPLGLNSLWMNFGFDDSTTFNANKDAINSQKNDLQKAMDQCCKEFSIGCGITVKVDYDYNRKDKQAPSDGTYNLGKGTTPDASMLLSNLGNINTPHSGSGLNILITGSSLEQIYLGNTIVAQASTMGSNGTGANSGYLAATGNLLSHEGAHQAVYDAGDVAEGIHSSDPNNIMNESPNSGQSFDKCACQKMAELSE